MNKIVAVGVATTMIAGLGGFVVGMQFPQRNAFAGRTTSGTNMGAQMRQGQAGVNQTMRPVAGEILSLDENSFAVKLADGSSKIVIYSDSTVVNKATQVDKSELKAGESVMVTGETNADGSVTAQNIQLGMMYGLRGGPGPLNN